jgi:hypothetical protein
MNKEQIQERIKTLEAEKEKAAQLLVMYEGAIQDCKFWLTELEKPEEDE